MKYAKYRNYIFMSCLLFSGIIVLTQTEQKLDIDTQSQENKLDVSEENEQMLLDDEKLLEEIIGIISISYKEAIDLSALYFCGLIDWDKLYDQAIHVAYRDSFKIIKLFSWYIPAIFKNPKISNLVKLKKAMYVAASISAFWYLSKEYFKKKEITKGIEWRDDDVIFNPRQRPSINL